MFVQMQSKRHKADYDPDEKAFKSEVVADINAVEDVIKKFANVPIKHRRAFATFVLFKIRGT